VRRHPAVGVLCVLIMSANCQKERHAVMVLEEHRGSRLLLVPLPCEFA
jgi:hypothetical protein